MTPSPEVKKFILQFFQLHLVYSLLNNRDTLLAVYWLRSALIYERIYQFALRYLWPEGLERHWCGVSGGRSKLMLSFRTTALPGKVEIKISCSERYTWIIGMFLCDVDSGGLSSGYFSTYVCLLYCDISNSEVLCFVFAYSGGLCMS